MKDRTGKILIPDELKHRIKNSITDRTGLYFKDHDLGELEDKIALRMVACGIDSPVNYYSYLTTSSKKEDELRELLNLLTINHTYFFRNEAQFKALKERILPEIIERKLRFSSGQEQKEKKVLRIWSAGCSTGEEPYTIAIIVREAIPDLENWEIQIIATDVSSEVLEKARKGVYERNAVKFVSPEYLEKYFTVLSASERTTRYEIRDTIKSLVSFSFHNLMDSEYPVGFDVIFCRNVVIYFELETTLKIMEKFYSSLLDDGFVFIGYSENLHFMQNKFKMIYSDEAIYYRKIAEGKVKEIEPVRTTISKPRIEEILEEISRKQILALIETEASKVHPAPKKIEDILIQANKNLLLKKYDQALLLLEEAHMIDKLAVDPLFMASQIYVNQGRFNEAKDKISAILRINPMFAPAHYLLGCIYIEEQEGEKAKESLKKSLYLDKNFTLANFYLANVYKNENRFEDAIRGYRNTLKLLSNNLYSDIIPYSGGFDTATLMNVCRDNIERLKMGPWT
ncbi:MAG: hypothetical protein PHO70_06030 [Candidatus Omnitrophica bacterium]|nr:hypothetical protein [Candidatus Omnitrophota bacterium]